MKKIVWLALLLTMCLTACGEARLPETPEAVPERPAEAPAAAEEPEPIPEPEPEPEPQSPPLPMPEPRGLTLYRSGGRTRLLDETGRVLLERLEELRMVTDRNDQPKCLSAQRYEGKVENEWGWLEPERQWMDIYDMEGNPLLTEEACQYAYIRGEMLITSSYQNDVHMSRFYRLSDGRLLFEGQGNLSELGEYFYYRENEEDPGVLLDHQGNVIRQLELQPGMTVEYPVGDCLLVRSAARKLGLLDRNGEMVLDCAYREISWLQDDWVQVRRDGKRQLLDLKTGEAYDMGEEKISEILPGCAILWVKGDFGESFYRLVDREGKNLLGRDFEQLTYVTDEVGRPTLFFGTVTQKNGKGRTIAYSPDGQALWSLETGEDAWFRTCGPDWGLLTSSCHDPETDRYWDEYTGVYLETGAQFPLDKKYTWAYALWDYGSGDCLPYLVASYENQLGWERSDIVGLDGTVILEDLQDCVQAGTGLLQCRRGFEQGLMRLDGTWLYREPAFTDLGED